MIPWLAALTACSLVLVIVPMARLAAIKGNVVDKPNPRKIHAKPIPLLGGVAIFIGIAASMWIYSNNPSLSIAVSAGGAMIVVIGLLDDLAKAKGFDFPVWPRVIVYLLAACVPVILQIKIIGISNPFMPYGGMIVFPEWLSVLSTIIWIFALINMINFIDGVDGLAAGVAMISSVTLYITALLRGQPDTAILSLIVFGSCAAFLGFNFYPAKIFMGDAGSAFLGYVLAIIAINGTFKSATLVTIFIPILALGVPILDTLIVMTRRLIEGRGLHKADKTHTHHVLMRWGLTQVQTVSFLYLLAVVFSLLSILLLLLWG